MMSHHDQGKGFGTTADEWNLLQLGYNLAVEISQGKTPAEELIAKFRYLDEKSSIMLESWWFTRQEF